MDLDLNMTTRLGIVLASVLGLACDVCGSSAGGGSSIGVVPLTSAGIKEIIPWPLLQHLSRSGEGRFSSNVVLGEDVTLEMQAWRMEL